MADDRNSPLSKANEKALAEVLAVKGNEDHGSSERGPNHFIKIREDDLKALGLYKGELDGKFGPQLEEAVKEFQTLAGLPSTGKIDERTRLTAREVHEALHDKGSWREDDKQRLREAVGYDVDLSKFHLAEAGTSPGAPSETPTGPKPQIKTR